MFMSVYSSNSTGRDEVAESDLFCINTIQGLMVLSVGPGKHGDGQGIHVHCTMHLRPHKLAHHC
jgi:hypothetical protein